MLRSRVSDLENLWGIGPVIAARFKKAGISSVPQLLECAISSDTGEVTTPTGQTIRLSYGSRVALAYYGRIKAPIHRKACEEILAKFRAVCPEYRWVLVGSYRRGSEFCRDVDLLVTTLHKSADHRSKLNLKKKQKKNPSPLASIIEAVRRHGLIEASAELYRRSAVRYAAYIRHGSPGKFYRIDINWSDPKAYMSTARLSYTGSADFIEGMRERAAELGMKLCPGGLFYRHNKKRVPHIRSEADVFRALLTPYVEPHGR
jgi:DNA polymerase/3'-5' exonuclease PolX